MQRTAVVGCVRLFHSMHRAERVTHQPAAKKPRAKAYKDWFDRAAAVALARQIANADPNFRRDQFVTVATRRLDELEFSQRVKQFSDALRLSLPAPVPKALQILTASLPEPLPDCNSVTDGWLQWPIGHFIADHGVDHFEESFDAMTELTQRLTSEFAVRPFIERYPRRAMRQMLELAEHPSPHVRRWSSEGTRPRLPWGRRLRDLVEDPSAILPILEKLKDDREIYVRKSVANNLNDIAKDHPALVIACCERWKDDARIDRQRLIRQSLRTLIKAGEPEALAVIGVGPPDRLHATFQVEPSRISVGQEVTLQAVLRSSATTNQSLIVDYVVHFVRGGSRVSRKVFKWKTLEVSAGSSVELQKRHAMRSTTVRTLYAGRHRIELQVNGRTVSDASFELFS